MSRGICSGNITNQFLAPKKCRGILMVLKDSQFKYIVFSSHVVAMHSWVVGRRRQKNSFTPFFPVPLKIWLIPKTPSYTWTIMAQKSRTFVHFISCGHWFGHKQLWKSQIEVIISKKLILSMKVISMKGSMLIHIYN